MRVSVVIPVYNEVKTVTALLDSVARAPYPDGIDAVELVAVNDCSRDGTRALLEQYRVPADATRPTLLTVLHHDTNQPEGLTAARGEQ